MISIYDYDDWVKITQRTTDGLEIVLFDGHSVHIGDLATLLTKLGCKVETHYIDED